MNDVCGTLDATSVALTRRRFVRLAALGAGIGLFTGLPRLPVAEAADHAAEALLLSCMDFRLMDAIERYMSGRGLAEKYDHVILAGASLGALTPKYPAWNKTFWQHLDIAMQLHHVEKVMVMDHRDCGAYKVVLGEDFAANPSKETQVHTEQLKTLAKRIHDKHPKLKTELLLMSLDGTVKAIDEA